jgi:hypothetical protein
MPKNDLAARAAAATSRDVKAARVAEAAKDKPVRLSVDVDRGDYHGLVEWCQGIAMKVGRTRVNHVWVIRALISELFEDEALQQRVINRVREEYGPESI